MALIIERINKAGHVLMRDSFAGGRIDIGRGLDQAVIIDDALVDASHIQLEYDAQSEAITCTDLASVNGVSVEPKVGRRAAVFGSVKLNSGDKLVIGRTQLRVLLSSHPVAPTQKLTFLHECIYRLTVWPTVLVTACLLVALIILESYFNLPNADHVKQYASQAFYTLVLAFIYAGTWAVISRALTGEGRLIAQLLLALMSLIVLQVLGAAVPWLSYHLPAEAFWPLASKGVLAATLFIVVVLSARMATKLGMWSRVFLAGIIPIAFVVEAFVSAMNAPNNSVVPYQKNLVAPHLNIRSKVTSSDFVTEANALYLEVDSEGSESH